MWHPRCVHFSCALWMSNPLLPTRSSNTPGALEKTDDEVSCHAAVIYSHVLPSPTQPAHPPRSGCGHGGVHACWDCFSCFNRLRCCPRTPRPRPHNHHPNQGPQTRPPIIYCLPCLYLGTSNRARPQVHVARARAGPPLPPTHHPPIHTPIHTTSDGTRAPSSNIVLNAHCRRSRRRRQRLVAAAAAAR